MKKHTYYIKITATVLSFLLTVPTLSACVPRQNVETIANSSASEQGTETTATLESSVMPNKESTINLNVKSRSNLLQFPENSELHYNIVDQTYTVDKDFGNIDNKDVLLRELERYPEGKESLVNNYAFFISTNSDTMHSYYEVNRYDKMPSFITADVLLNMYHKYFDYVLKTVEKKQLYPKLQQLLSKLRTQSEQQYEQLKDGELQQAAVKNYAYFTIADFLLNGENGTQPPQAVKDLAAAELVLINAASEIAVSPLMSYGVAQTEKEDYSQYKARSHYAGDEELERYFKALMFLGRMRFTFKETINLQVSALQMAALQQNDLMKAWNEIDEIIALFSGQSDDPSPYELLQIFTTVFEKADINDFAANNEKLQEFKTAVSKLPKPKINDVPLDAGLSESDREEATFAYRFMGQRYNLDAEIFGNLLSPKLDKSASGSARKMPTVYDIPATFGSTQARSILKTKAVDEYPGYWDKMEQMNASINALPQAFWQADMYSYSLHAFAYLLNEKEIMQYPSFMRTELWQNKLLNTYVSAYTELKHDTVLYSKQIMAEMGGLLEPEDNDLRGYVEPLPQLYHALYIYSQAFIKALSEHNLLSGADLDNLRNLSEVTEKMCTISVKELQKEDLSKEEYDFIISFGGQLEHLWSGTIAEEDKTKPYSDLMYKYSAKIVTDIATDPNSATCLQEAIGSPYLVYVIVPVAGSLRLCRGVVYSHYEFTSPIDKRMTDQEWRQLNKWSDAFAPYRDKSQLTDAISID